MSATLLTSYIGITGFTAAAEVSAIVGALPAAPARLLMCGVLLSNALLDGRPSGAPQRCPPPDAIAGIFAADPRCLNLVHYRPPASSGRDGVGWDDGRLADALARAAAIGGPNCHGVQINATRGVPWPDATELAEYRQRCRPQRIVLQAGREAMASVDGNPQALAQRCAAYAGIATDILVDASEGLGRPLDAARTARYLDAIATAAPDLGLVAAGGLCAANLAELLGPLLPDWGGHNGISIDAEGRLRDGDDLLDIGAAKAYIATALTFLQ